MKLEQSDLHLPALQQLRKRHWGCDVCDNLFNTLMDLENHKVSEHETPGIPMLDEPQTKSNSKCVRHSSILTVSMCQYYESLFVCGLSALEWPDQDKVLNQY